MGFENIVDRRNVSYEQQSIVFFFLLNVVGRRESSETNDCYGPMNKRTQPIQPDFCSCSKERRKKKNEMRERKKIVNNDQLSC